MQMGQLLRCLQNFEFYLFVGSILVQFSHSVIILMSTEQLPCIQLLECELEKEAQRMSQKIKDNDLVVSDADELLTIHSPQKEEDTEIQLNIDETAIIEKKTNIFQQRPSPEKSINIFANTKSVNLFNFDLQISTPHALNIFAAVNTSQISTSSKEEENQSNKSQSADIVKQETSDPLPDQTESSDDTMFQRLGEFKLVKFKAGSGAIKEEVYLSIEKHAKSDDKILFLILRSEITKIVVFKAIIFAGTKVEEFMNKEENIKLTVMKLGQLDPQGETKREKEQVKLQFEKTEDSKRFKDVLITFFKPE